MTKTEYLFGCSSIISMDPKEVFSIAKTLHEKDALSFELNVKTQSEFTFENADEHFKNGELRKGILRALPPLLRSYIHCGAKVHGYPALDKDFGCVDMFTVLDLSELSKKYLERYFPNGMYVIL